MTEQVFDPREKFQSQVPALQMLVGLGFTPLSPADALRMRGGRRRNVILDEVLVERTLALNSLEFRGQTYSFDVADAHEAMRKLAPSLDRQTGMQATSQEVYDTLLLGTTITKSIDGDAKSHSFRYVDWITPENNAFHVTAEYSVERTGSTTTKRCDIVAFVNGIPFIVIENKQPAVSVHKAGSQLIGYQSADNIPQLFHYAQLLLSMNRQEARYATVGTPRKFWHTWRDEEDDDTAVAAAANTVLSESDKDALFGEDHDGARGYFDDLAAGDRAISAQDRLLYALCRPERLLDLVRRFTVFDAGVRKIARHQQFFAVKSTLRRIVAADSGGTRPSGVIWHTQGSGKSLTMVMLGKALALEPGIRNPRIIIVTDRIDLDKQIRDTFRSCQLEPVRATTGKRLAQLIRDHTPLITTVVNKFDSAAQAVVTESGEPLVDDDADVFVLVDESHRTQTGKYGGSSQFNKAMRRMLPGASYLAFTGTPLLKREKNTFGTFGELFHKYTIADAVADGAVVPLLYEGRMVEQLISENVIDRWFDKISEGLTVEQKRDLKRKFSRADALSGAGQVIRAKAFDISEHYRKHWQGTGFKAQLVAPNKAAAIRFKQVLDEIGHVTSEVVISAPGDDEDHEAVDRDSRDLVQRYWDEMMRRFGSETAYNDQIVAAFKASGDPEILIVVSKLLTGFDAPRNTVLYMCRRLSEHTLLQAIARVNRLFEEDDQVEDGAGAQKEFGYIIDYEGLLGDLDQALTTYATFDGFEEGELTGAVSSIRDQVRLLPARWSHVWELFNGVPNKSDMEALEQFLADDAEREEFYERLAVFARCLHMALASEALEDQIPHERVAQYRRDWKRFVQLRKAVQVRYQEIIDLHDFEPKIHKLLDDHVSAMPAETIIELVDINDPAALEAVIADTGVSAASRADRIASATLRTIHQRMDEDPALYARFSRMIQDTIDDYRARRLSEIDYLASMKSLSQRVAARDRGRTLPPSLTDKEHAASLFETLLEAHLHEVTTTTGDRLSEDDIAEVALGMLDVIESRLIVGIWANEDAQRQLLNALDDYILEELERTRGLIIPADVADEIQSSILARARARFP